jgi:hypothetical protein
MAKRRIEIKLHISGPYDRVVTLTRSPQPDYLALTDGQITSCHGCGEDCRRGSSPGGPDCTVQNDIKKRRRSRQN